MEARSTEANHTVLERHDPSLCPCRGGHREQAPSAQRATVQARSAINSGIEPTNNHRPSHPAPASRHRRSQRWATPREGLPHGALVDQKGRERPSSRRPSDQNPQGAWSEGTQTASKAICHDNRSLVAGSAHPRHRSDVSWPTATTTHSPQNGGRDIRPPHRLPNTVSSAGVEREARPTHAATWKERSGEREQHLASSTPTNPPQR